MPAESSLASRLERDLGSAYAIPVGSGLTGLSLILEAHGVAGKKVLLPALTGWSVPVAVLAAGGTPVLVDVTAATCNLAPNRVSTAMDPDVRAVIVVNNFGYPAEIDAIRRATPEGVLLIEDACQSYGGCDNDRALGTRGDAGVLSFGHGKPIVGQTGGFVLTDDSNLAAAIRNLAARPHFRISRARKIHIKCRCVENRRYQLMRVLATRRKLLDFDMSRNTQALLAAHWDRFMAERLATARSLHAIGEILADLPRIQVFDYRGSSWLPWRYSFQLETERDRLRFHRIASEVGLRISRLYQTLDHYHPGLDLATGIPNATRIAERIHNLSYLSTRKGAAQTLARVDAFAARWTRR